VIRPGDAAVWLLAEGLAVWKKCRDVEIGDSLLESDGVAFEVTAIEPFGARALVFRLRPDPMLSRSPTSSAPIRFARLVLVSPQKQVQS
jgi:hypothetical protein